jgi:hypothetical protein
MLHHQLQKQKQTSVAVTLEIKSKGLTNNTKKVPFTLEPGSP